MTATIGTYVSSANPNNTTNKSLVVALASTVVGDLNVIEISGFANNATTNPAMATPTGWTKLFEQMDTNGTPASFVAVYFRIGQTGDPASVTISWANAGQMVALCHSYTNFDAANPIPYFVSAFKVSSDTNYSISGTTGSDVGILCYGFANRTGTAWSSLSDTDWGTVTLSSSSTMTSRAVTTDIAAGTAFTKSAVGSNTSVGVSWAYVVKSASASPPASTSVDYWLAHTPQCAHRGGDLDWVEHTSFAYAQSNAYGAKAIEASVWRSSDGVWVVSHDKSTLRMTGTDLDITANSWATLSALRTTVGNYPLLRLKDVLDLYAKLLVIFIENKQDTNIAAFLDFLETYSTAHDKFVVKGYVGATTGTTAKARGFATWGYYYETDVSNLATTQDRWTILGMDFSASTSAWTSILSYGKPVLAHITSSAADAATGIGKGAVGVMTSKVVGVITPRTDLAFAQWDGTYERPLTVDGVWNGTAIVPVVSDTVTTQDQTGAFVRSTV